MKYHELIELYKKKELSEEEMHRVEKDIERQEAISEYLFDRDEAENEAIRGLGGDDREMRGEEADSEKAADPDLRIPDSEEFTRRVNRSIRRAFIKMGTVVGAVVLVVVLLVIFVLPEAVSLFYYDPGKTAGKDEYGTTNQMSLDMAVYSELMLPGYYRTEVQVEDRGYGDYDILIQQTLSFTGRFNNVAGRVEKGKLNLYDPGQLQLPTGNAFGWFQMSPQDGKSLSRLIEENSGHFFGAAGDREQSTETLNALDDNARYLAYVTLDNLMPYEDYIAFAEQVENLEDGQGAGLADLWCAPVTEAWENGAEEDAEAGDAETEDAGISNMLRIRNLGFYTDLSVGALSLDWNREKYPDLVLWANDADGEYRWDEVRENMKDEDFAAEHFAVMLDYMSEQDEFLEMLGGMNGIGTTAPETLAAAADYVRENGLTVYGFACQGTKEALLELNEMEEVYGIYAVEMR